MTITDVRSQTRAAMRGRSCQVPADQAPRHPAVSGVVVLDGQDVVRVGLAAAVRQFGGPWGLAFAGAASTTAELRAVLSRVSNAVPSQVVVVDPGLADGSDVADTVGWLVATGRQVVIYTDAKSTRLTSRGVLAGAQGVSLKSEPVQATLAKVRAVAAGRVAIPAEYLEAAAEHSTAVALSLREREVLRMYAGGHEVAAIAKELYLTENSVKEYLRRLRGKYAAADRPASSKVDLLRRAIEDGILPPIKPH